MHSLRIFYYFFLRDWHVNLNNAFDLIINYVVLYPFMNGIAFLYLQPSILFGTHDPHVNTVMFIGNIVLFLMVVTYKLNIELLFDLENNRYIDYQISILSPRLVLIERILFSSCFTWVLLAPAYPLVALYFPAYLDTSATSWWQVMLMLYCGALFCSAYHNFIACILPSTKDVRRLWIRYNQLLFLFGGFQVPWYVMNQGSPILGYLTRLNPMMYITEGLRSAFLHEAQFFPVWICVLVLLCASVVMTIFACKAFKKRVDHV